MEAQSPQTMKPWLIRFGWAGVILLCLIGAGASLAPYLLPHDVHLTLARILYGDYTPQIARLAELGVTDFLHRSLGALYFVIAPLQFVKRFRSSYPAWHRWSGRLFLVLSVIAGTTGMIFTWTRGFSGFASSLPITFLFIYILYSGWRAYQHARQREFAAHREWMIHCFAGGSSIATIRVFYLLFLYTTDLSAEMNIVTTFWLGPLFNFAVAAWWIQYTRPASRRAPARARTIDAGEPTAKI